MNLSGKNILITQIRLHDYAGSEIITLEMAEYFSSKNANVIILTHTHGDPIEKEFRNIPNVVVLVTSDEKYSEYLQNHTIDIAWVHHQLVPKEIINNPKTKFIYHHMSPYAELELPLFWRIEESLADIILFNSEETRSKVISDGYFKGSQDRLMVFGNPSPSSFFTGGNRKKDAPLANVLVVSNHPPQEVLDAIVLLQSKGINVETFGSSGDKYVRMKQKHLARYGAVITIGKTVQYSIASNTAVYCYDHFGGPGYLNDKNYDKAKELNFSGRGFSKKTKEEIADEIVNKYNDAVEFGVKLATSRAHEFSLEDRMDDVLVTLGRKKRVSKAIFNHLDILSYVSLMSIIERNVRGLREKENEEILSLRAMNATLRTINNITNEKLNNVLLSKSYRITRLLLVPVKLVRRIQSWLRISNQ